MVAKHIWIPFAFLEQLQYTPVKSRRGRGPRVYASSVSGGRIIKRGSFLCAGYASKLKLRAAVFGVFSGGTLTIEPGALLGAGYSSTSNYASKLRLRVPVFVVFCRVAWMIGGNFLYWLHVYAWLQVKIKAKGTGVRSVLSWILDDRTRQFLVLATRLRVATRQN